MCNTAASWAPYSTTQSKANGSTAAWGVMAQYGIEMLKAMSSTAFHRKFMGPGRPGAHSTRLPPASASQVAPRLS